LIPIKNDAIKQHPEDQIDLGGACLLARTTMRRSGSAVACGRLQQADESRTGNCFAGRVAHI